ncbi:MAG: 3-keto-disaccharide hydrolase [Bryobacteraceae bacterium]
MRLVFSAFYLVAACSAADWVSIQPDSSFKGWTRGPLPPAATLDAATQWSVSSKDGDLICDGAKEKGHEWLRYDRELKDFVLHVEWRFRPIPGETKYNSGVFVRNSANGAVWYQAQVGPPANGGYFFSGVDEGEKKRVNYKSQMKASAVKDPGEWNTYEIRAEGKNVTLFVNGTETSSFECDRLSGYLGLEAEHYHIEFRNIKLKELP